MPHVRFAEDRQPLEVIRFKIRRMNAARRICDFNEQQQARYNGLLSAEKRFLDALRGRRSGPPTNVHPLLGGNEVHGSSESNFPVHGVDATWQSCELRDSARSGPRCRCV